MNVGVVEILSSKVSNPIVTIAIPTYLRVDLLQDAIESAINQTFDEEYEIIVVDNNPERNDDTELLMQKYVAVPNIAYYKNAENIGMMGNWNRLYELSKGKYVAMLHDDDILFENFLSTSFQIIRTSINRYSFIYPALYYSRSRKAQLPHEKNKINYRVLKSQDFVVSPLGIPSGTLLEKEKFKVIGPYTMQYYPIEDQEFVYRALRNVNGCRILTPYTIMYYMGEQNASCKPENSRLFVINTNKFYDTLKTSTPFPWSFYIRLTKCNLMNSMMVWWSNFGRWEDINNAKDEIGFKSNKLKDFFSKIVRRTLALYLKIVRSRSLIIINK